MGRLVGNGMCGGYLCRPDSPSFPKEEIRATNDGGSEERVMSEERQRRPVTTIMLCMVGAFALYVLSVGPSVRFAKRPSFLTRIYAPLEWLDNNCTPFSYALSWYVGLWERKPAN